MSGQQAGWERSTVPLSLLVSFAANDGEELRTMASTQAATVDRLPGWWPLSGRLREVDQTHVTVAVTSMGLLYAVAAFDGVRSRGRSPLYQDVQWVFGVHGLGHLAAAALTRGYVTGVLTCPTVVLPQWWWVSHRLRSAGVERTVRPARAAARSSAHR